MDFDADYIKQCIVPGVEPAAIEEIINETSGYNELAVKVMMKDGRKVVMVRQPTTVAAMVETVTPHIRAGAEVRFGLTLIPARLLPELKVSVAQAAEPCTNIRIASLIYKRARELVMAAVRNPREQRSEIAKAYATGTYNGAPIEGLAPEVAVVVARPPQRDFERREAAGSAERQPRPSPAAYAAAGPEASAESPSAAPRRPTGPAEPPSAFEVHSAPMTIDLSRFREAR